MYTDLFFERGSIAESYVLVYPCPKSGLSRIISHHPLDFDVVQSASDLSFLFQEGIRPLDFLLHVTPSHGFMSSIPESDLVQAFPSDIDLHAWFIFCGIFEMPYKYFCSEKSLASFLRLKTLFLAWYQPRRQHLVEVLRGTFEEPIIKREVLKIIVRLLTFHQWCSCPLLTLMRCTGSE